MSLGGRLDTNIQIKPNKLRKSSVFVIPGQLFSYFPPGICGRWCRTCSWSRGSRSRRWNILPNERGSTSGWTSSWRPRRARPTDWDFPYKHAKTKTLKHANMHDQIFNFWHTNISFFHYRCWFWSRLRSTSPPTCPLTTRLKRRTSPSGTFLLQRRWEWNTTFFTPGGGGKVGVR